MPPFTYHYLLSSLNTSSSQRERNYCQVRFSHNERKDAFVSNRRKAEQLKSNESRHPVANPLILSHLNFTHSTVTQGLACKITSVLFYDSAWVGLVLC